MGSTKSRLGKQERQGKTLAASTTLKLEPDPAVEAVGEVIEYLSQFDRLKELGLAKSANPLKLIRKYLDLLALGGEAGVVDGGGVMAKMRDKT